MTISMRIILIVGFLSALLLAACVVEGYKTFTQRADAIEIQGNEVLASDLIVAARHAAVERGLTQGLIASNGKTAAQVKDKILARRDKLDSIIKRIDDYDLVKSAAMRKPMELLNESYDQIVKFRTEVDLILNAQQKPSSQLRSDWFKTATRNIDHILLLKSKIEAGVELTTELAINIQTRHSISALVEVLGRERGRLNGYIAADLPLFPNEVIPLREIAGGIGARLHDLEGYATLVDGRLAESLKEALAFYQEQVLPVRNSELKRGQNAQDYSVSSQEWFELASKGITQFNMAADIITVKVEKSLDAHVDDKTGSLFLILLFMIVVGVLVMLSFAITQKFIRQPIEMMVGTMGELSKGNLDAEVPNYPAHTEVGRMSAALEKFRAAALENERYRLEQEEFKRKVEEEQRNVLHNVADEFESAVGQVITSISSSATELASNSDSVMEMSSHSLENSNQVRELSTQAVDEMSRVSNAAEEMAQAIGEIARQVTHAADQTMEAAQVADQAGNRVNTLVSASKEITGVLQLITDIAEQTNLLALNATVEAARAGEAGKGFAVVASEVKNLANQTHKATENIEGQISAMIGEIEGTTQGVRQISRAVVDIRDTVQGISAASEELSASSSAISTQMGDASVRLQQSNQAVDVLVDVSHSTKDAVAQVNDAARWLSEAGVELQNQSETFLMSVRQ